MADEEQKESSNKELDVTEIFKKSPGTKDPQLKQQITFEETETPPNGALNNPSSLQGEHNEPGNTNGELHESQPGKLKVSSFIFDLALNLFIVFGLVFLIQTFLISPFKVFGPSMCNTLNYIDDECSVGYGEYIIVNKLIYKDFFGWSISSPERGDILVFHPPHSEDQFYIKRVIGVPGDTIKLIDGYVYLFNTWYPTGLQLDEPYLNENNFGKTYPSTNKETTFKVPEGKYFLMGDNRNESTDSRSCFRDPYQGGCLGTQDYFLSRDEIEGKAWVVLWPLTHIRVLENVTY